MLTTSFGFAQENGNGVLSIRQTLDVLISKVKAAENEILAMRSKYGENHPSMKQAKVQLAKIVETKTQLATQYAMSKLKHGNIVCKNMSQFFRNNRPNFKC